MFTGQMQQPKPAALPVISGNLLVVYAKRNPAAEEWASPKVKQGSGNSIVGFDMDLVEVVVPSVDGIYMII